MKLTEDTQLFTNFSQSTNISGGSPIIFGKVNFTEKCNEAILENTEATGICPSGFWRTNSMLEDRPLRGIQQSLALRHITSFEEKSMEIHGKKLHESLMNYVNSTNAKKNSNSTLIEPKAHKISDWEQFEETIILVDCDQKIKNALIKNAKINFEAQMLIKQVFQFIPEFLLPESLLVMSELFSKFNEDKLDVLEEEELKDYILSHSKQFSKLLSIKLAALIDFQVDQKFFFQFEKMIETWMDTVLFCLNGVFDSTDYRSERKCQFEQFSDFESFSSAQKLIKLE